MFRDQTASPDWGAMLADGALLSRGRRPPHAVSRDGDFCYRAGVQFVGGRFARRAGPEAAHMRARELGLGCGSLPVGARNSIADVPGVTVGHRTLIAGDLRTGVTAILPH